MNKSQIFSAAHKIAKNTVAIVGDYQIAFSLALRDVYSSMISTENKLLKMGFSVWENHGHRRIYINIERFGEVFGLELSWYKTGNISSARLNGERISNSRAYQLIPFKAFYDCVKNEWNCGDLKPII
ncbi:hypothetical protein [Xenorhabdus ehlersii]|uniref:Uncharacterized protein n=1 Tax=Xenorhabdus ehlersii TaxID=290111 RepID=A0A2D0IMQ8_9GAMM|nr:hypothetical protein [Xenorhabdus ehlersii]PHM23010.1 hypothetical protein Xehl_03244 [Xenorhabdus ehlersii]RKE92677.1 hypothetical protein BDE27_0334 [Xenorhabdus ehlersii]